AGARAGEHLPGVLPLLGRQEQLPERTAAELGRVVLRRQPLEGGVEAHHAALEIQDAEEGRRGVDDRADEVALALELGQPGAQVGWAWRRSRGGGARARATASSTSHSSSEGSWAIAPTRRPSVSMSVHAPLLCSVSNGLPSRSTKAWRSGSQCASRTVGSRS